MPTFWPSIPDAIRDFIVQQPVFFVASAPLNGKHVNISPKGHPSRTLAILNPNQVAYIDTGGSGAETISHIYENGRVTMMFCSFVAAPRIVRLFCRGRVIERGTPEFRPFVDKMVAAGMQVERPDPRLVARMEKFGMGESGSHVSPTSGGGGGGESDESGDEEEAGKKGKPEDIDLRSTDGAGLLGARAVVILDVWKVQKSCGFGVPLLKMDPDGALAEGPDEPQGEKEKQESSEKSKSGKQERSEDAYNNASCKFDEAWDDRTVLTGWVSKMVQTGKLVSYRKANNTLSLDGLPGLHQCRTGAVTTARQHLNAWTFRTFVGQWQAVLTGFFLALLLLVYGIATDKIIVDL